MFTYTSAVTVALLQTQNAWERESYRAFGETLQTTAEVTLSTWQDHYQDRIRSGEVDLAIVTCLAVVTDEIQRRLNG